MGLTKQYLKYEPGSVFGLIGAGRCIYFITHLNEEGKTVVVPACEIVYIWDLRKKVKLLTLKCEEVKGTVTILEPRPSSKEGLDNTHVAVGYSEGSIVLYDTKIGQPIRFNGHKGGISTIAWDHQGMRIASGSEDGEIVLWDVVSERGIVRLRGHKGRINKVRFLQTRNILVSSAKDSLVKFWDLDTNFCFYTLSKNNNIVWDFITIKNDTRLLTGGEGNLSVWDINFKSPWKESNEIHKREEAEEPSTKFIIDKEGEKVSVESDEVEESNSYLEIKNIGRVMLSKADHVCGLVTDGRTIGVHGKSSIIDLYVILNEDEISKKIEKRMKKSRKRAREHDEEEAKDVHIQTLADEIKKLPSFKALNKVSGISLLTMPSGSIKVVTLHVDNSIALYRTSVAASHKDDDFRCSQEMGLCLPAHRTEIKAVAFNSHGDQIITVSSDAIKVWNRANTQVITTIKTEYSLSLLVPPGDRHVIIGTRSGRLKLYELASGILLEDFEAHDANERDNEKGIWSLALIHDGKGFISGGSDCMVKFWTFELVTDINGRGKRLSFVQDSRALKVADQITDLKCGNLGKYLAVATFDMKETVYYTDSLKLVHEFYGKSMPSTCLDFSSDDTLIITGSRDSCIRIFASDFGDQKRLLKNCHQGGVTDVKFIKNTHMFFSCGNDGMVKQWDADNFQRITTLQGHSGMVRCLDVSVKGSFVVSCGKDRAVRLWKRTNEPLVLEDEREEERRREEEEMGVSIQTPVVVGENDASAVRPTKISHETEKAVDQLLEALTIYREQREAGTKAIPNQLMTLVYKTSDPLKFVLLVLQKIKSSELEETILVLPLNMILILMVCIKGFLSRDWDIELSVRVLVVAVRINLPQLISSSEAADINRALVKILPQKMQSLQDIVGYNLAGLRHLQARMEQRSENQMFVEAAMKVKEKRKRRQKKERSIKRTALLML